MSPLDGVVSDYVGLAPAKPAVDLGIFDRAADLIERRGWVQAKHMTYDNTDLCLMQGICKIAHDPDDWDWEDDELARAAGFADSRAATQWNDAPGRTQAEVVDRLRRAARGEFL